MVVSSGERCHGVLGKTKVYPDVRESLTNMKRCKYFDKECRLKEKTKSLLLMTKQKNSVKVGRKI